MYMRQFVCSVVVGEDLIPHLGIKTLVKLKEQMHSELNNCHLPKVALWLHFSVLFKYNCFHFLLSILLCFRFNYLFVCLSVCVPLCLLAGLCKNYSINVHKFQWKGVTWHAEETVIFWW